jgi:hypothetical protein
MAMESTFVPRLRPEKLALRERLEAATPVMDAAQEAIFQRKKHVKKTEKISRAEQRQSEAMPGSKDNNNKQS